MNNIFIGLFLPIKFNQNFNLIKTANFLFFILFICSTSVTYSMEFDEGIDYKVIDTKSKKINENSSEVIEFFGYFCPHCKSFAPSLNKWEKSLPKNVKFIKLHVPFRDINHQRLFFTLKEIFSGNNDKKEALTSIKGEKPKLYING